MSGAWPSRWQKVRKRERERGWEGGGGKEGGRGERERGEREGGERQGGRKERGWEGGSQELPGTPPAHRPVMGEESPPGKGHKYGDNNLTSPQRPGRQSAWAEGSSPGSHSVVCTRRRTSSGTRLAPNTSPQATLEVCLDLHRPAAWPAPHTPRARLPSALHIPHALTSALLLQDLLALLLNTGSHPPPPLKNRQTNKKPNTEI